jgi:hypothetical protein
MEDQKQLGRISVARSCLLSAATAVLIAGIVSIGASRAQDASCVTSDQCAERCKSTWKNSKWKSAQDCIRNLPCSQYPKRCIAQPMPKMHGDPPSNN